MIQLYTVVANTRATHTTLRTVSYKMGILLHNGLKESVLLL